MLRRDTNDRERPTVDLDRATDDRAVTGKCALPQIPAQHRHRHRRVLEIVARPNQSAERRPNTEHREIASAHEERRLRSRFRSFADRQRVPGVRGKSAECAGMGSEIREVGVRQDGRQFRVALHIVRRHGHPDLEHLAGRRDSGRRLEEERIDNTEHRGIGSDTQGQRRDCDRREPSGVSKCAGGVSEVVE
jgi:hypothetical protein